MRRKSDERGPFSAHGMLPMHYAPLADGEVPEREFALPLPTEKAQWHVASVAARLFWQRAVSHQRLSVAFRAICCANASMLDGLLDRV